MALPHCQRAAKLGMAVEVELGRLAGGEAGVRTIDEGALTKVEKGECASDSDSVDLDTQPNLILFLNVSYS